ncbi:hypothetical protein ACIQB5_30440 [Streptomyces sp. NPDC088560]|uniref:hypothetical protein n=1 Tax=Streptomyces sp. NPDC088560 TaxID=3365868 RepID=UPI0037F36DD3
MATHAEPDLHGTAAESSVVALAREPAGERLAAWHQQEAAFTAELVVSELVSDASSTAPRLRRARLSDEGGRGLLIVAQLSQRWGRRAADLSARRRRPRRRPLVYAPAHRTRSRSPWIRQVSAAG